jgi:hypothetical protein
MKLPMILFSAFFVAALLDAGVAESKTAGAKKTSSSQTVTTTTSRAMYECEAQYAGPRGVLGNYRYGLIEGCFKALTGMYPFQAHENCALRHC